MKVTTIVLINGLWLTALSWELWVKHFAGKGYSVLARSWPWMEGAIEQPGHDPSGFLSLGLAEVVDHYEQIIRELETPPIIIGHGFGGLITQILLDRGWGAAGVAVAPAPVKGVRRLPLSLWKMALSDLGHGKVSSLTVKQFHNSFANTLTEREAVEAFDCYSVPGPKRVLLQATFANFTSHSATTVNPRNDTRAPLLLVAGGKDRFAPPSLVKANFDLYRDSKAETDYKEFPDDAHFTLIRDPKIADYALGWALCRANGSKLNTVSSHTDSWSVQFSA